MSLFDLLFLAVVATTVFAGIAILALLLARRWRTALRTAVVLGIGLAVYLLIVAAVALLTPQRVLRMGEDRCFDEMCFAPTKVATAKALGPKGRAIRARGTFYLITVRASSRARRRPQRELGVIPLLIDSQGRQYAPSAAGSDAYLAEHGPNPPLTSLLIPGESLDCVLVFDIPSGATGLSLHLAHDGPGPFIIGDDENPLHKPTITPLAGG